MVDALPFDRSQLSLHRVRERAVSARDLQGVDALLIGPGPMDPVRAGLVDIVHHAAARRLPTLGVCLGHQAIGLAFGATLVRTAPVHGKTATFDLAASRWLPGVSGAQTMMRYHSLALTDVRAPLRVLASTSDGVVMAVEHATLPILGVQFHPDSYASRNGPELIAAFFQGAGLLTLGAHP